MSTRRRPQASVLQRGVLDREPETSDRHRLGVEERGVLVTSDLTADAGLLEDVHALQGERVVEPEVARHLRQLGGEGEAFEHRIEVVHRMTDLVDAESLWLAERARVVERLFLEEAPSGRPTRQEFVIADAVLLLG